MRAIPVCRQPAQALSTEAGPRLWREFLCFVPRTWLRHVGRAHTPGSQTGAPRIDRGVQDRAHPADTSPWLFVGPPRYGPLVRSPSQNIVSCNAKSFQRFPPTNSPGGREATLFKYMDLKTCF